jgi:hypothetical protein
MGEKEKGTMLQLLTLLVLLSGSVGASSGERAQTDANRSGEFVSISKDGKHFICSLSGAPFVPWGFNYDHDASNRLLETYWEAEWAAVEEDFAEMKALGANTVRIHLQVSKFIDSAQKVNEAALGQLGRVLQLAQKTGLYLDITGLGCYDRKEVPSWYNELSEADRWEVQARFWEAISKSCGASPAVFCYDLMNEPIVTEDKKNRDWTPGAFGDRYFVQRLTLDFAGRTEKEIAKAWVEKMAGAIRKHDARHLITVGAIPWALTWPKAKPLFYSTEVSRKLDFVSVHFYPREGEVGKALKALAVYDIGKPIVIEEMFPLSCSLGDLDRFIDGSRKIAAGWLGFYWGKTIAEYRQENRSIADDMALKWLEYFVQKTPSLLNATNNPQTGSAAKRY